MTERRRFNGRERAALYLAADGRCSRCGVELEPGWHADHVDPYSHGGVTDVINGQALCPTCNLIKGDRMSVPRGWQAEALDKYLVEGRHDWLACATPGAGKTRFALFVAEALRPATIRQIAIVVPSDALRDQWCDEAAEVGIHLRPVKDPADDIGKAGYDGFVVTYAQVMKGATQDLARRAAGRTPTLAVFDEIHHAGDSRSWGDGLRYAFEPATRRLALTGTPWRSDPNPIPFVTYHPADATGKQRVKVDYEYGYGRAVNDGVCRSVVFHAYDGDARWIDCGKVESGTLTDEATAAATLDVALRAGSDWMLSLLRIGAAELDQIRSDIPDAGGLVVAEDRAAANAWAATLETITGEPPVIVHGDIDGARDEIVRFRKGRMRWIVAVQMVSEGVDIKRLAVVVYATKKATPLFFRQVVGRVVRVRPDEELTATVLLPAVSTLTTHARQIEQELRHEVEEARKEYERTGGGGQDGFDFREPLSTSETEFEESIYGGEGFSAAAMDEATRECATYGFSARDAAKMARLLADKRRAAGEQEAPTEPKARVAEPKHRYEKRLRDEVERLARKVAHRGGVDMESINKDLKRRFGARGQMSVEQLAGLRDTLAGWLGEM